MFWLFVSLSLAGLAVLSVVLLARRKPHDNAAGTYTLDKSRLLEAMKNAPLPARIIYENKLRDAKIAISMLPPDQRAAKEQELAELAKQHEEAMQREIQRLVDGFDTTAELRSDGTYSVTIKLPDGHVLHEDGTWEQDGEKVSTVAMTQTIPDALQGKIVLPTAQEFAYREGVLEVPPAEYMPAPLVLRRR
jgi:hypothetical protein